MANYTGGGGGGASVVPATFVVASDREDYPLTQAGLAQAIADLPAGGGDIYIGAGTLAITAPITIDKHVKLIGSGAASILSVGAGVTAFIVNAIQFEMVDLAVAGDNSAGSVFLKIAGTSVDHEIVLDHVVVGPVEFAVTSVETIFHMDGYSRPFRISNCLLIAGAASPDPCAIRDGSAGQIYIVNSSLEGAIPDFGAFFTASNSRIGFVGTVQIASISRFANCAIAGTVLRFSVSCKITGGSVSGATLEANDDCAFDGGCSVASALTAIGDRVRVDGCEIVSFSSNTHVGHILNGNRFTAGGNTVTLTASTDCIVSDNRGCQVLEVGACARNRYDNNHGFAGSTILALTSLVENENFRNVMTYGATGDGATDDSAAIQAAVTALPTGGGTLYFPPGNYLIGTVITLSKDVKVIGAGIGVTVLTVTAGISMFQIGDFELTMSDFSVVGNNTAAQTFLSITANATNVKVIDLSRIRIGSVTGFGTEDGTKIFIGNGGFSRIIYLTDITLTLATGSSFYAGGGNGALRMVNVFGYGLIAGAPVVDATNVTINSDGGFAFGNQGKFTNCRFTGSTFAPGTQTLVSNSFLIVTTITFGNESLIANTFFQCTTTTLGTSCEIRGGNFIGALSVPASCVLDGVISTGAVTATGSKCKVIGCTFTTFTCATAGADNHVIKGCTFTGGGNNVILTDCDGCVVAGNITCQVQETASSDANKYDDNGGFSGSTIIGPNSSVNGAKRYGATGATADAYATLFTVTNSKGLLGYGTIKNTDGADSMTVEEQGIDAFGPTTDVIETVVAPGDEMVLDPTNNITTARPPYTSYRVRVKSTSAGNPAAHSTQFVSQGDMA